jgi:hypothetical protein
MFHNAKHGWAHRRQTSSPQAYKLIPCLNSSSDYIEK